MMIERLGYEAVSITSSLEALTRKLRCIRPDIRIILCPGFSHTMTELRGKQLGIDAFLMKSLIPPDLEQVIQDILGPATNANTV